jgi:hypothetical protein
VPTHTHIVLILGVRQRSRASDWAARQVTARPHLSEDDNECGLVYLSKMKWIRMGEVGCEVTHVVHCEGGQDGLLVAVTL